MVKMQFNTIPEILNEIKNGRMVIIMDDEDRENEGDLVMAGSLVEPHHITFMATHGKGLICSPISDKIAKKLDLKPMVESNSSQHGTAFTVSVDAKENISTGISSADRSHTIKLLSKETTTANDFIRPGHIFPLIANPNGVTVRAGHTEATIDLMKLAGLPEVGVICEIINYDGTMMRRDDLLKMARDFNLKISTIKHLQEYLKKKANVDIMVDIEFPTRIGNFRLALARKETTGEEHLIIYKGNLEDFKNREDLLLRMHSECFTGDIFGSTRCDCGEQLDLSLNKILNAGEGLVIYLRQEGRGIGLLNKLRAYEIQDQGFDTVEANLQLGFKADQRTYDFATDLLKSLGISSVNLMSNNPAKISALENAGISVSRIPIEMSPSHRNYDYLLTKKLRMGHMLNLSLKGNSHEYN
jgi:3,4-dihydroxy 2-butanone 4-phosphate synthase/GTP cyclohydrolase II